MSFDGCYAVGCKRKRMTEGGTSLCVEHALADLLHEVRTLRSKLNGGTVTLRFDMDVPEPE